MFVLGRRLACICRLTSEVSRVDLDQLVKAHDDPQLATETLNVDVATTIVKKTLHMSVASNSRLQCIKAQDMAA
jgi:hypothetical protein